MRAVLRVDAQTVLTVDPLVASRVVDGCAVAVRPASPESLPLFLTFNATGTIIWEALLDGQTDLAALLDDLGRQYPETSAAQRRAETLAFLEQLVRDGLAVTPRPADAA